jgi:uncharacterized membrane protein (UPF0127 family)
MSAMSGEVDGRRSGRSRRLEFCRVCTAEGKVLCERCEIPESSFGRARGLLGRSGLEPGEGMLIDRAGSVHMFFMRFPIDVVFLARDRSVVGVKHRLAPWRVAGARGAVASLELPAGRAAEVGVEPGDVLVFEAVAEPVNGRQTFNT